MGGLIEWHIARFLIAMIRYLRGARRYREFPRKNTKVSTFTFQLIYRNIISLIQLTSTKQLIDKLDMCLTELLDMAHQPNKIGPKSSTLHEIDSSYGVNRVPIERHLSTLIGESSNAAPTKQKRKTPEAALDREKKRQNDRAYRLRCKEKKMKIEQDMVVLTEENDKLKRENGQLKREGVKQPEMVKTQNEEMKVVNNELRRLKDKLQIQNAVVGVLSSQLTSRKDNMDLQCENKQLRLVKSLLIKKMNNNDYSNLIQLQEKSTKLEQEKNVLQVIIDALCAKINKDNDLVP